MTTPSSTSAKMYLQSSKYLSMVELCWDRGCFYQQKRLMEQFLRLQSDDTELLPGRFTLEDMSDWLLSQRKVPDRLMDAASEEETGLTRLTWWVNANLMMRSMELQVSDEDHNLSQTSQHMNLADATNSVVAKARRSISGSVAFQPCFRSCCPADLLVDLVPRLLLSLTDREARDPWHRRAFMAMSNLAVSIVLQVLEQLSSTLTNPACKIKYSRATGINMVRKVVSRIRNLNNIEELNSGLESWSPGLIAAIADTVTEQVQKLLTKPPCFIVPQTASQWLSKNMESAQKSGVRPDNPKDLVLHINTIKTIIGLAVTQMCNGDIKSLTDLQTFIAEVESLLAIFDVKVSKKVEKVTWNLDQQEILNMVTHIHNFIHSFFGTKLNLKMALSAKVHLMTRAMAYIVTRELLTLREALYGKTEEDFKVACEEEEHDTQSNDSCDDIVQDIITLFLQRLIPVADGMGDRPNLNCLRLAPVISTVVYSIADTAGQSRILFQQLAQIKLSDSLDSMVEMIYMDYFNGYVSPQDRSLEAFTAERIVLVANMVVDRLLGRTPPRLSRSTTHFELNPTSKSWGKAKGDARPKTATEADHQALKFSGVRADHQSADIKPKTGRIRRFFRRVLRFCCISRQKN